MKLRKTFRTFRPALRLRVVLLLATGTAAGSTAAIDTVLAAAPACVGDYDGDGNVTMDEIIVTVNAVLDGGDTNVNVGDVVTAVNNARSRCPQPLTPTPTATPSTTGPCVPTPSNMVAWWPLDEPTGSGVVSDIGLPIANDGTSQPGAIGAGGPNAVAGNLVTNPPDSALFFYSPTTYVEVPPSADLNLNDLTVDGWVGLLPGPWTAGTTSLHVYPLVDKLNLASNTGYAFYVEVETTCSGCNPPPPGGASSTTNMRLVLALGNGALNIYRSVPFYSGSGTVFPFPTPPTQLAPTQPPSWLHAAVVLDHGQSVIKFYYNGAVLALYPNPVVALNNNDPLWVGGTRLYGTSHAPAFTEFKLNEIEVFNVPLPQSDLQSIAHSSGGKCKPCGFIGPRMCGGTCPNPNDVCRPRPDDSGCFCNSEEPFPTPTPTSLRSATPTRTTTRTPTSTRTSGDILRTATPTRTPTSMTATPTGTQCVPTPSSMIAWWKLNELTGSVSVVDIGGSPAHNGTSQQGPIGANGPVSVPGNLGTNPPDTALLFSTPATYVEVPATSDLELVNSDLTIDAWIESIEVHPVLPGTIHVVEPIVDKLGSGNTGYALYLEITATCLACPASGLAPPGTQQTVDMRLVFAIGDGANMFFYPSISIYPGGSGGVYGVNPQIPIAPPWPAGWMHLTVSIDRSAGNVGTFYLNGNTKGSFTPVTGQNSGSTVPFWIGGTRLVPTTVPFHGEIVINELEIFDAALSQADIQSIVNAPDGKCTPVPTITATPATATPTRTPSRSPSATVSRTATDTRTATRSPSPTPSTTSTATITSTRAPTATPTVTRSASPTPTATPCCRFPISLNIASGQAPGGQSDPAWQLISAPAGTTGGSGPHPAVVIAPANGGWNNLPGSQWTSANTDCVNTIAYGCPSGTYSYELCWSQLCYLDGALSLSLLADNSATVFLNGNLIGSTTGGFTTPTTIAFADPGPSSRNCLRVDVANSPDFYGNGTATGMNLSASLTGCVSLLPPAPTSTPTVTASFTPGCPGAMCTPTPTRTPTTTRTRTPNGPPPA